MAEGKRYYWLRLHDDFFASPRIKKLRRLAGGDTFAIIYLKMQLRALKTEGVLYWTGLEPDFADELALDLDEEPDNVKLTLAFLLSCGLAETDDNIRFFLPAVLENTGSETASTQRWRDWKARKALDSNTAQTLPQQTANADKEIEKEKRIERDRDKEETDTKEREQKKQSAPRFSPPALEAVKAYCLEKGFTMDPEEFTDYYEAKGWKVGSAPMKDWKAACRNWERRDKDLTLNGRKQSSRDRLYTGYYTKEECDLPW